MALDQMEDALLLLDGEDADAPSGLASYAEADQARDASSGSSGIFKGSPPARDPLKSPLLGQSTDLWWVGLLKKTWPSQLGLDRGPIRLVSACTGASAESAVFQARHGSVVVVSVVGA